MWISREVDRSVRNSFVPVVRRLPEAEYCVEKEFEDNMSFLNLSGSMRFVEAPYEVCRS